MRRQLGVAALACAGLLFCSSAWAADHTDSPAASAEPTADILDFYSWMTSDANSLNLVATVQPFATAEAAFSDAVGYVFHVNSSAGYGMDATETNVVCAFYSATGVECWVGDEYVAGDASDPAGIASASGKVKVFAGLRDDPFFFELQGFRDAVSTVIGAAAGLTFDDHGCPALDQATSDALVGLLQGGDDGATDTLAGANVLALVVQVDKSLVNSGGPVLGTWVSTHTIQ